MSCRNCFTSETQFDVHINFLAARWPLQSYLVLGKTGKTFSGVKMRISIKSLFYAWARVGTFIGAIIMTGVAAAFIDDLQRGDATGFTYASVMAAACWVLFAALMLYPRRIKPRYARQPLAELATLANLSDIGWAALNVQYGRENDERPAAN